MRNGEIFYNFLLNQLLLFAHNKRWYSYERISIMVG